RGVERGGGEGLARRVRGPRRRGDQRLPQHARPAGRGDVRLSVCRSARRPAGATSGSHRAGGPRMSTNDQAAPITLIEALTQAMAYEIRNDERVVVLGEDVGVNGGVFRATAGLHAQFGSERVIDTPLDETT